MSTPQRWRLSVVLASCVFLAWSVQRSTSGLVVGDAEERSYVISVPAHASRNPAAEGNDIWLLDVVADGRRLPLGRLDRTGSWEERDWALVHRDDGRAATISFRGRGVVVAFLASRWSGVVHVGSPEGDESALDLFHRQAAETTYAELANGRLVSYTKDEDENYLRALWMLALALLAAVFWRPWRSSTSLDKWAIAHVAFLHLVVWITQGVGYNSDTPGYMEGAHQFAAGMAAYFPPGYSLFLAPWQALFPKATGLAVTACQHVLMVLTLVGLARMSRACLSRDWAAAALLLAGSLSPTLFLPQAIFSENIALFGMAGALYLVWSGGTNGSARRDVAAGVLAGWAALARVVPFAAIAAPVLILFISHHRVSGRAILRTVRVLSAAAAVVVVAGGWIWHKSGTFAVANSQGFHLYNRAVTEQNLLNRDGSATQRFLALMDHRPLHGLPHWHVTPVLEKKGLAYEEMGRLMGDVAWEGIESRPGAFFIHSIGMVAREYRANPLPELPLWASRTLPVPELENEPVLGIHSGSMLWRRDQDRLFATLRPALSLAPILGVVVLPWLAGRLVYLALFVLPVGYLSAAALMEYFSARYVVCVLPFMLILAPTPVAVLFAGWRRYRADRRVNASSVQELDRDSV
jgi:Dolichyl-phosphate-mannose-protein mannosyltransferase